MEAASPILNKVGQLSASPILRNILGQVTPKFDLEHAMAHRGIFIANLAKGQIGEQASNLLGSLLLSHLQLIAMARSELAPENRAPFFVHVDEFQSFGTDGFASLLSEARKFATHFSLANQYTEQLSDNVRAAVFGNAGTLMVFRVSAADAEILAPEFHPLPAHELVDQAPHRAWLRSSDGDQRPVFLSPRLSGAQRRRDRAGRQVSKWSAVGAAVADKGDRHAGAGWFFAARFALIAALAGGSRRGPTTLPERGRRKVSRKHKERPWDFWRKLRPRPPSSPHRIRTMKTSGSIHDAREGP